MSQVGKFVKQMRNQCKKDDSNPVQIGEVINLQPLTVAFQGVEVSTSNGDRVYVNNLILDDVKAFTTAQKIVCSEGSITENHTEIINDITSWLNSIHKRYILAVGDYVAVQSLGNNTYIVVEKVQEIE